MWTIGLQAPATVLLAGGVGLVVAGYVAVSRRDVEGTTEVAALVTLAAGVLAGLGYLALASGLIAVTSLSSSRNRASTRVSPTSTTRRSARRFGSPSWRSSCSRCSRGPRLGEDPSRPVGRNPAS